jgi:glycosyltransferase involved in cell wall biosynthesis
MSDPSASKIRVLFVNENIGGHATVHGSLKVALHDHPRLEATFLDVPPPGLIRRAFGARIPGLARLDLDLQPLRAQLALSYWVRRAVGQRRGTYDVVHVYTQNAALLLKPQSPVVISTDTTNAHNAFRIPQRRPTRFTALTIALIKPIERRAFARCALVVANSLWARNSIEQTYGVAPDKLRTIPFGIVGPSQRAAEDCRPTNPPTIGFVGRQFEAKGGEVLLEAFSRLTEPAQLLVISPEPIQASENVTVVSDLNQGDSRLWQLLGRCSIFAFPSPIDQAPNAVLEAMAAGLPVVAVRTGAVGEMLVDGETGFLIKAGDSRALQSALQRLLDDPDLRYRMGAAARQRFEQKYDVSAAVGAIADVFEQVVESSTHRGPAS